MPPLKSKLVEKSQVFHMREISVENYFTPERPKTDCWLLFKVSSYERLVQMQKGLLYMNSLDYFSTLKAEEALALRADQLERVYGILRAGKNHKGISTLSIKTDQTEEFDLGPDATVEITVPQPKNTMLFCMGAFADGKDNIIPGEVDGLLHFDKRFLEFGSHLLLITNKSEFARRLNTAASNSDGIFNSDLFQGNHGLVDYKELNEYSGPLGLYIKDKRYEWQVEYRICFGVEKHYLNKSGAFEFNIGDISDISHIISIKDMIDKPSEIKRGFLRKNGDKFIHVNK